jgi:prolipoprotein diacylglyceryl transferase
VTSVVAAVPAAIPSPTTGVWHLGPFPLRAYALCILVGIGVAVWITSRRLADRGYPPEKALDISAWAVPFGIVGGRIYHVITTPEPYFGQNGNPVHALYIWQGGLGIWGAIALGAVGAWIGARRQGVAFLDFADAAAPGVAVAHAIGRWGNWFNNELYGRPTDVPWGLQIHCWDESLGKAVTCDGTSSTVQGIYQPTFLYESIFLLLLALALVLVDRRFRLHRGQVLGLYVAGYPIGRIVVEKMRTDTAELIFGQRLNVWTSIVVFLLGLAIIWWCRRYPHTPRGIPQGERRPATEEAAAPEAKSQHTE